MMSALADHLSGNSTLPLYFVSCTESRARSLKTTIGSILKNLLLIHIKEFLPVFYFVSGKYYCGLRYQDRTRCQLFSRHFLSIYL